MDASIINHFTKGVKMGVPKGTSLYQAHPNNPKFSLRNIEGKLSKVFLRMGNLR